MHYQINEGALEVPDGLIDRSINMLMPPGSSIGFSFVVSRDRLEPGETLEGFVTRQVGELSRQVTKFKEGAREPVAVGPNGAALKGLRLEFNYKQNGQPVYQCQCVALLADQKNVLIFTGSAPTPFDKAMTESWERTVNSFRPAAGA